MKGAVGLAFAGDEIADGIARVIVDERPEMSGRSPAAPNREQDGPPIDRSGVDGRRAPAFVKPGESR